MLKNIEIKLGQVGKSKTSKSGKGTIQADIYIYLHKVCFEYTQGAKIQI